MLYYYNHMYRNLSSNNTNSALKINANIKTDKEHLLQTIDFITLKKKILFQQQLVKLSKDNQNILEFRISSDKHENYHHFTILTLIGVHYLLQTRNSLDIDQDFFSQYNIENCPKQFITYIHPKTLRQLLLSIRENFTNLQMAIQMINDFPVAIFVIESLVRMVALKFIKKLPKELQFGNQIQLLQNYSVEIRGHLLNIVSDSLSVALQISIQDKSTQSQISNKNEKQTYGNAKNKIKLKAQYNYEESTILSYNVNNLNKKTKKVNNVNLSRRISPVVTITQLDSKNSQKTVDTSTADYNSNGVNQTNFGGECSKCHQKQKYCICRRPLQRHGRQANLDFVGLGSNKKCKCNKVFCICK